MSAREAELRKLRVTDLRDLCREQSLATSGVKQELIDRLLHHEAHQSSAAAPSAATEIPSNAENFNLPAAPMAVDQSSSVADVSSPAASLNTTVPQQAPDAPKESAANIAVSKLPAHLPTTEPPAAGPAATIAENTPSSAASSTPPAGVVTVADGAPTPAGRKIKLTSSKPAAAKQVEATSAAAAVLPAKPSAAQEPYPAPETLRKRVRDEATSAPVQARSLPASVSPTCALHVSGFVRPFTVMTARELLSQGKTLQGFWMDTLKSQAYVLFADLDEARLARDALDGLHWPTGGKKLSAVFVAEADARSIIDGTPAPQAARAPSAAKAAVAATSSAPEQPTKKKKRSLESLFRKTKAQPALYWLPKAAADAVKS